MTARLRQCAALLRLVVAPGFAVRSGICGLLRGFALCSGFVCQDCGLDCLVMGRIAGVCFGRLAALEFRCRNSCFR
ncbi:hypothetical protein LJC48_00995 [Desulfovibrio sp. OttesenSCG-928-C06]|nr:hypothetical protein [Desulfovibrio sp. OttesenSCG-928-C06]